jgi:HD superfamily phosphohydrolase
MKKIVRLTEADLTRIVKRVIQEEQLNEKLNLKSFIPALAIAASLNLSSCKTKEDFKEKKPEIENMVKDRIEKLNELYSIDSMYYENIYKIVGPINESKSKKNYFIVVDIEIINLIPPGTRENPSKDNTTDKYGYWILVYQENIKTDEGKVVNEKLAVDKKDVNEQIDYYLKNNEWILQPN